LWLAAHLISIVLDANVVSEADKPSPAAAAVGWVERQDQLSLYLCSPVIMELAYGAERYRLRTGSDRYRKLLVDVAERFRGRVIEFDGACPALAGRLRAQRERIGRSINMPDVMIAAICIVHGATLATRNVRDFEGLALKVINPFEATA